MVQRICHTTFTTFLLTFAYMFLLVHNVVPHHHHEEAATVSHSRDAHHHDQAQAHGHPAPDANQPEAPMADPDHLLSNHQHPFADNSIFHAQENTAVKISKRQVVPFLICFLAFEFNLFRLPDKKPPSPTYSFLSSTFFGHSHGLRGPPVA